MIPARFPGVYKFCFTSLNTSEKDENPNEKFYARLTFGMNVHEP